MSLIQVTPPAAEPISLEDARRRLHEDALGDPATSAHDPDIAAMIKAAREYLDGSSGILGRALVPQTWELRLDGFPGCWGWTGGEAIDLPLPPLRSVEALTYLDTSGSSQTMPPEDYQVVGLGGTAAASIVPAFGKTWPSTRLQPESVAVRFVCGYASGQIPEPIVGAMHLLIGHWFENRQAVTIGLVSKALELGVTAMVGPYRVQGF